MNTIKPLISIITCTRNSEQFLKECLESVKIQTFQNFEHIFIDTNSTDNTIEIIKQYSPNSQIVNCPKSGIYHAFNQGLKKARGSIIGFLHSDDAFTNNFCLEKIAKAFSENENLDYYCSKMEIYYSFSEKPFALLGASPHKQTFKEKLYSSTYYAHPTYYCHKDLIKKIGFYNENYKFASDIDWLIRLEQINGNSFFDSHPLIKFRSNGSTAQHYLLSLLEEWKIKKIYEGLSLQLIIIYAWHFLRRIIRFVLETLNFDSIIMKIRGIILQFHLKSSK